MISLDNHRQGAIYKIVSPLLKRGDNGQHFLVSCVVGLLCRGYLLGVESYRMLAAICLFPMQLRQHASNCKYQCIGFDYRAQTRRIVREY